MDTVVNLIIQLSSGVVGGNAAGAALKDYNLGNLGNTIARASRAEPARYPAQGTATAARHGQGRQQSTADAGRAAGRLPRRRVGPSLAGKLVIHRAGRRRGCDADRIRDWR